jgi:hypothetical protein
MILRMRRRTQFRPCMGAHHYILNIRTPAFPSPSRSPSLREPSLHSVQQRLVKNGNPYGTRGYDGKVRVVFSNRKNSYDGYLPHAIHNSPRVRQSDHNLPLVGPYYTASRLEWVKSRHSSSQIGQSLQLFADRLL